MVNRMLIKNALPAEQAAILTAEHLVFSLLGKAFFEYPDKNWIDSLAVETIFNDVPFAQEQPDMQAGAGLLYAWSQENQDGLTDAAFAAIVADYTRLFIGPGEVLAPPWESVYFNEERLTFQEETLQARSWFRRHGLESVKLKNEPDDHVGLELAFLAHVAGLGLSALEQKDETAFRQALEAQEQFFSEHLLRWVVPWSNLVLEYTQTDFYRGFTLMVRGAVYELAANLGIPEPEKAHA